MAFQILRLMCVTDVESLHSRQQKGTVEGDRLRAYEFLKDVLNRPVAPSLYIHDIKTGTKLEISDQNYSTVRNKLQLIAI